VCALAVLSLTTSGRVTIVNTNSNVLVFYQIRLPVDEPEVLDEPFELVLGEGLCRVGQQGFDAFRGNPVNAVPFRAEDILKNGNEPCLSFATSSTGRDECVIVVCEPFDSLFLVDLQVLKSFRLEGINQRLF